MDIAQHFKRPSSVGEPAESSHPYAECNTLRGHRRLAIPGHLAGQRGVYAPCLMQRQGAFYIGNFGRIPLFVDISALFLVAFVLFIWDGPISARATALAVLVLSIVLHELGHAVMALWFKANGVSIYLTGLGGLCSYQALLGPKEKMAISMAGPAVNGILAVIGWALYKFVLPGLPLDGLGMIARYFIHYLFYVNLFLGILNSLPIYPMDGGQTLFAALHWKGYSSYRCRKWTLIASFVAAGVGILVYTFWTGQPVDTFLTLLLLYLLYQAYTELS